jgi:hypothetical protein
VRLTPEGDTAGTAVAPLDVEPTLIDELRHPRRLRDHPRDARTGYL